MNEKHLLRYCCFLLKNEGSMKVFKETTTKLSLTSHRKRNLLCNPNSHFSTSSQRLLEEFPLYFLCFSFSSFSCFCCVEYLRKNAIIKKIVAHEIHGKTVYLGGCSAMTSVSGVTRVFMAKSNMLHPSIQTLFLRKLFNLLGFFNKKMPNNPPPPPPKISRPYKNFWIRSWCIPVN